MIVNRPIVSILMPCYNSRKTIPMALASVLCQNYENFECILVDDGSTDNPKELVNQANDSRIKYFRLDKNMGRPFAFQFGLDHASGELLCMLGADDWIYPTKIQKQLDLMENEKKIVLVSTGMAIVDEKNDIIGVRSRKSQDESLKIIGPFKRLTRPPVAHGTCMIRMHIAKNSKFDPRLLLAQDMDFLLQTLINRYYCIIPEVLYVYSEFASKTTKKYFDSKAYSRIIFSKYKDRFPISSRANIFKSYIKSMCYLALFASGLDERWVIQRKLKKPTKEQLQEFKSARQSVSALAHRIFT